LSLNGYLKFCRRWLFIVEGAATVVIAVAAYWVLPDFPKSTKWLTTQERDLAVWRLEQDVGKVDWEGGAKENIFHGLKLAFTDGKTYVLGAILFGEVSSGSVTNFFPTVVETLGYNPIISLLLTAPPYVSSPLRIIVQSHC
jgi:hypothetical protein